MWEVLETIFWATMFIVFLTTFLPDKAQRRVSESFHALLRLVGKALIALVCVAGRSLVCLFDRALPALWHELVRPGAYRLVTGQPAPPLSRLAWSGDLLGGELHDTVEDDFPLPAAENGDLHGGVEGEVEGEIEGLQPATEEEIRALVIALRHNLTTADKTKSGAIKAGWGLARSGSDPRYARASEIYDLAMKKDEPMKYRNLDEERQPVIGKRRKAT